MINVLNRENFEKLMSFYDEFESNLKNKLGRDLTDFEHLDITFNLFRNPKQMHEKYGLTYNY